MDSITVLCPRTGSAGDRLVAAERIWQRRQQSGISDQSEHGTWLTSLILNVTSGDSIWDWINEFYTPSIVHLLLCNHSVWNLLLPEHGMLPSLSALLTLRTVAAIWRSFPHCWPFVRGIHHPFVYSLNKLLNKHSSCRRYGVVTSMKWIRYGWLNYSIFHDTCHGFVVFCFVVVLHIHVIYFPKSFRVAPQAVPVK